MAMRRAQLDGQMKLSDLKPCASCNGALLKPSAGMWYVIRKTQAMLNPRDANRVLGLTQFFQGSIGLAETFETSKPVMILGDCDRELMDEVHICFECWTSAKFDAIRVLLGER